MNSYYLIIAYVGLELFSLEYYAIQPMEENLFENLHLVWDNVYFVNIFVYVSTRWDNENRSESQIL